MLRSVLPSLDQLSLRRQMVLVLGMAGVFPLLIAGILVSPMARDNAERRAQDSLVREACGLAEGLGLWIEEAVRNTQVAADSPGLAESLGVDPAPIARALDAGLERWKGRILELGLWSLEGRRLASTDAGAELPDAFLPFGRDPRPGVGILQQQQDRWTVQITAPVRRDGATVAVLLCTWDASPLIRAGARVDHESVRVGLLHEDGRMVCVHPRQQVQRASSALIRGFDPRVASSLGAPFLQGESELHLSAIEPLRGVEASTSSPTVPFMLVLARPRAEARADAAQLERAILFAGIGVTLAICLAACILARVLGSPLQLLTRRVEGFAVRIGTSAMPPRGAAARNEIQQLGDSFEHMADRVEQHQEQLFERNVELRATLERLRATDQVKDEFLSFLSHEMRTPLTAIRSFAELLRTTAQVSDEEREEFLSIIESECIRLETLSHDLLDLARIQLGEMRWRDELLDPGEVVESVVRTLRVLAVRSGAHLLAQCGPDLPAIRMDRDKLVQVITNLVANALKFTPSGGQVTVRASAAENGNAESLRLQVLDTGPGIPGELLEEVFNPFVQAHAADASSPRGSGLGLAICQRIVEHYDGVIRAHNGPHGGAILELDLPAAPTVVGAF